MTNRLSVTSVPRVLFAALGVWMTTGVALAQEPTEEPAPVSSRGKGKIDEIVITGSRIQRDANLGSIASVQTLGAEEIELSGELDLSDVLNDIPALLTSTTPGQTADSGAAGRSVLSLRGLGAARTLTLIDGRRHVPGVAGTAAVDIGSVPAALVERVEVLTGGASSIYGADAVSGVVNFVLKKDFEGLDLRFNGGRSDTGDAETVDVAGTWGMNFSDGRGNITFSTQISRREALRASDREFSRNNGPAGNVPNPDLRFQVGDINASTPNLARFYAVEAGRFPTGLQIPLSADAFLDNFARSFPGAPTPQLTPEELALFARAAAAPPRAIIRQPTFSISSAAGFIAAGPFAPSDDFIAPDTDGDGTDDCIQSFVGIAFGGCYTVGSDGRVRPFRDGLIAAGTNQLGGDGIAFTPDTVRIVPEDDRKTFNFTGSYLITDSVRLFAEAKYATSVTEFGGNVNSFYDTIPISAGNPFIPVELQGLAADTGGLFVTKDFTDLGRNIGRNTRRTMRFIGGIEGDLPYGFNYEVTANFGRFESEGLGRASVIQDRLFAALDVVRDANGNPICRSDIDPTPNFPTSPFPATDAGFFTFRPGDGSCQPLNLFGVGNISPEAVDFVTQRTKTDNTIDQYVFSAILSGDLGSFFSLQGGDVGFALGFEYRDEKSQSNFSGLARGVLPLDVPAELTGDGVGAVTAGSLISDLPNVQNSLVFDPTAQVQNSGGTFNVKEMFAEVSLPVLRDLPFAAQLTLDSAARVSKYSTVGSTFTWNYGATWAPVNDIRFRWTLAEAVRAPNIGELFSPDQGAFFRPIDPCTQAAIAALRAAGDPRAEVRASNCLADGIPVGFEDPLTARFAGVSGGNRNLLEETARTQTAGVVLQPRWMDGLAVSVDYFQIEIEDAISAVSSQNIVDGCYDSGGFPGNQFCSLFTRNRDSTSMTFLGFNFLRQQQLNFAKLRTTGVDFSLRYDVDWGDNQLTFGFSGTRIDKLDNFFDPQDPSAVDPALGEIQRPEWAGSFNLGFTRGPFSVRWETQYQDNQTFPGIDAETADVTFGGEAYTDELMIHNVAFRYEFLEDYELAFGVNNVSDVEPFRTEIAIPVSPVGRTFFFNVRGKFF